jgi:hypothetical protein
MRITPQFSGGVLPHEARRWRTVKCRAGGAPATPYHRPLQLLVSRRSRSAKWLTESM